MSTAKKLNPNTTPLIPVRHNGDLLIATGRSRYETA